MSIGDSHHDAQAAFGAPEEPKRVGVGGYLVAALMAVGAIAGAIAWIVAGFTGLDDAVDDLHRVPIPGAATVHLDKGKGSIYYEFAADEAVPGLNITLRRVDGPEVAVGPHGGEVTYDFNGNSGTSIAGFEVDEAGDYRVRVRGPEGGNIAIGKGVGGKIASAIVGALVIFFGGLALAGVLIIVTARRRRE